MKKLLLVNAFLLSLFIANSQVVKTNSTPGTVTNVPVGGSHLDRTFTYTSADFSGCPTIAEVDISVHLLIGNGTPPALGTYGVHEDLNVRLVSPIGTFVDLVQDNWGYWTSNPAQTSTFSGLTAVDGAIHFDDDFVTSVSSLTDWTTGSYSPHNALSLFDGEDAIGTWTLQISDGNGQLAPSDYIHFVNATLTVTGSNSPIVSFTAPPAICESLGSQFGLGGGFPAGGVYSGPGVFDDGNGSTFTFDPVISGAGLHVIEYTYTDANGCTAVASDLLEVEAAPVLSFTAPADICLSAGPQVGLGGGSPSGGTYSGPGVLDDFNGFTYTFDPATAGIGIHTIIYEYTSPGGCFSIASDDIEVLNGPAITFTSPGGFCESLSPETGLGNASPSGGVYSGPGVTDDGNGMTFSFDSFTAGVGTHTITYSVTDVNGCSGSEDVTIEVYDPTPVTMTLSGVQVCLNAGVQTGIGGGLPVGGAYSGTGVTDNGNGSTYSFDPSIAGTGWHLITYSYTDPNGCSGFSTDGIQVFALPSVSFTAGPDRCLNAGTQSAVGTVSPVGGMFSGSGVTDDSNGSTYTFEPAIAGAGVHAISYTYTDTNSCSVTVVDSVEVFAVPTVTFTGPTDACINAGPQSGLGNTSVSGGIYSGPGVTDDGNGLTFTFIPLFAGAGTHAVSYSVLSGNGCTANATDSVEVFASPVVSMNTSNLEVCEDAGVQTGLSGGTPIGGAYSGTGVMDDGNGTTYSFDPTALGGATSVFYDYTDSNGCTIQNFGTINVLAVPTITFSAGPDRCVNAGTQSAVGTVSPTGGMFSGPGVTDDSNGTTYTFEPATAGVGVHVLTYSYTATNGCNTSVTDTVEVFAVPTVSFTAPADLCENAGVQTGLGGASPTGGFYAGSGVTDGGNGLTYSFDPSNAGVGVHSITYNYLSSDGCFVAVTDSVEVSGSITIVCPNDTIVNTVNSANCSYALADFTGLATVNSCSSNFTVSQSSPPGTELTSDLTLFMLADDANGNSNACSFNITVLQWPGGTAYCKDTIYRTLTTSSGINISPIEFTDSLIICSGGVGNSGLSTGYTDFDCNDIGTTNITATFEITGLGSAITSCSSVLVLIDSVPPSPFLQFPVITSSCGAGVNDLGVALGLNCAGSINGTNNATLPITALDTTEVLWTFTHPTNGLVTIDTQLVIIQSDITPPLINCPNDTTVFTDPTSCSYILTDFTGLVAATDNCSSNISISQSTVPGTPLTSDLMLFMLADDGNGNSEACSFTIDVVVNNSAVVFCKDTVVMVLNPTTNGNYLNPVDFIDSSNYCGAGGYNFIIPNSPQLSCPAPFPNYGIGTNSITILMLNTMTTTSCTSTLVVIDSMPPQPFPIADLHADCEVTALDAITSAAGANICSGGLILGTHNATLPITAQDTTVVTWTFTSPVNGLTSTQTQLVIINDDDSPIPTVGVLPNISAEACQDSIYLTAPTAYDSCAGMITGTTSTVFPLTVGFNAVIWTFDDGNGNIAQQAQLVTFSDTEGPYINEPTNPSSVYITGTCFDSIPQYTATDVCVGTVPVTAYMGQSVAGSSVLPVPVSFPLPWDTTYVIWSFDDGINSESHIELYVSTGLDASTSLSSDGGTITANLGGTTTYEWINCDFGTVIPGETGQSFTPPANGSYSVVVTEGACSDTSDCVTINTAGLATISSEYIKVYPNPSLDGHFTVDYDETIQAIEVRDMLGRSIDLFVDLSTGTVDGSKLAAGRYIVQVRTEHSVGTTEIVIAR